MKRLFRSSADDISVNGLLSLAVLTGIAAGIVVPLTMKAMGMIGSQPSVMAATMAETDPGDFSTAAGSN